MLFRSRRPVSTGPEALIGRLGEAVTDVERDGLVRHGGELWTALVPNGVRIPKGSPVVITEVQGVKLVVRPLGGNERPEGDAEVARRNGREE